MKLEVQDVQTPYRNIDNLAYMKYEEIEMKPEVGQDVQEKCENVDKQFYNRAKVIKVKVEADSQAG